MGSLRDCLSLCTLSCLNGRMKESFIISAGLALDNGLWTGVYQRQVGGSHDNCADGSVLTLPISNWKANYYHPDTEACTFYDENAWKTAPCDFLGLQTMRCLCEAPEDQELQPPTPAHVLANLASTTAASERWVNSLYAVTFQAYVIGLVLAFAPAMIYFVFQFIKRGIAHRVLGAGSEGVGERRIRLARSAAANQRVRVSGLLLQLGLLLIVIASLPNLANVAGVQIPLVVGSWTGWMSFLTPGLLLLLLAVFPTDAKAVRVVAGFLFGFCVFMGLMCTYVVFALITTWGGGRVNMILYVINFIVAAYRSLPTLACECCIASKAMTPRATLRLLWSTTRQWLFFMGLLTGYWPVESAVKNGIGKINSGSSSAGIMAVTAVLTVAVFTPGNRGRAHRYLASLGKANATKESEAATIAALVAGAGASADDALSEGRKRFRVLPLAKLTEDDLLRSNDTGLFAKTEACGLGEADAFVSHSWSDE